MPGSSTLLILNDCSVLPSIEHPLQCHSSLLSSGGVGITMHVKVMLDPTGNSKTFSIPLTGIILVTRSTLYSATVGRDTSHYVIATAGL